MERSKVIERALDLSEDQVAALPSVGYRTNIATRMSRLLLDGVCLRDGCEKPYQGRSVYCGEHSAQGGMQDKSARAFVHAVFAWMARVPVKSGSGLKSIYLAKIHREYGRYAGARTVRLQMRLGEAGSARTMGSANVDVSDVWIMRRDEDTDVPAALDDDGAEEAPDVLDAVARVVTVVLDPGLESLVSRYRLADGSVYDVRVEKANG